MQQDSNDKRNVNINIDVAKNNKNILHYNIICNIGSILTYLFNSGISTG
jgi:hypothetical protein